MFTHVKCLKDYYSALDRDTLLHRKGRVYKIEKANAADFYSAETEKQETSIGIQLNDPDYDFLAEQLNDELL